MPHHPAHRHRTHYAHPRPKQGNDRVGSRSSVGMPVYTRPANGISNDPLVTIIVVVMYVFWIAVFAGACAFVFLLIRSACEAMGWGRGRNRQQSMSVISPQPVVLSRETQRMIDRIEGERRGVAAQTAAVNARADAVMAQNQRDINDALRKGMR